MCIVWTIIALACLGAAIVLLAAFRVVVPSREFDTYPEIQEEVPLDRRRV